jgi:hypothetical protein
MTVTCCRPLVTSSPCIKGFKLSEKKTFEGCYGSLKCPKRLCIPGVGHRLHAGARQATVRRGVEGVRRGLRAGPEGVWRGSGGAIVKDGITAGISLTRHKARICASSRVCSTSESVALSTADNGHEFLKSSMHFINLTNG